MTKYVKICKINYRSFYQKSCETNLSLAEISLSCHKENNMYLHLNPSFSYYIVPTYNHIQANIFGGAQILKSPKIRDSFFLIPDPLHIPYNNRICIQIYIYA